MEIDSDINRTAALFKQKSPSAPAPNPPPSAQQLGAVRTISHQQSAMNSFPKKLHQCNFSAPLAFPVITSQPIGQSKLPPTTRKNCTADWPW